MIDPDLKYQITFEQNQVYLTVRRAVSIDAAWAAVMDMIKQEHGVVPRDIYRTHWIVQGYD